MSDRVHKCAGCSELIGGDYAYCEKCAGLGGKDAADERSKDASDGYLSKNLRRRYAKAKAVFEIGVWSARSLDNLFGVMIGSADGVRNSYDELRLDNRRLRFELKALGLDYADCFSLELSPASHEFTKRDGSLGVTVGELWHGHGFFKMAEIIKAKDLHSALSPIWGNIHGSQVVDVKIIYDEVKAIKYTVKDAVKNYLSEDHGNKRLLRSRNWLPEGYPAVDKTLTKWALCHGSDWGNEPSEPDQGYAPRLDFVPLVWEVKRDYLKRWCRGESVSLDFGDYHVYIIGESITKYAVKK